MLTVKPLYSLNKIPQVNNNRLFEDDMLELCSILNVVEIVALLILILDKSET